MHSNRPPGAHPTPNARPVDNQPSEWQRFGARLRQLRTQADRSPEDLPLPEVCSPRLLHAIEEGEHAPNRAVVDYLDRWCDAHGRLMDAWARALLTVHLGEGASVEALHTDTEQIREFQPGMVPEFFQTRDYARALAEAARPLRASLSGAEQDRALQVRFPGFTDHGPPYFCLVLNESALRAVVGGVDVTREQLRHLLDVVRRDHVSLHIIPDGTRDHPCRLGPFRCLAFSAHHHLAYAIAPCGPGHLVTEPDRVRGYTDLFEALKGEALPQGASVDLLARILDQMREPRALTAGTDRSPLAGTVARPRAAV